MEAILPLRINSKSKHTNGARTSAPQLPQKQIKPIRHPQRPRLTPPPDTPLQWVAPRPSHPDSARQRVQNARL